MLTVPEVAAQLRVTKMTVYRLCHSGDLPHIRVGRGFRIFDRALHRFLLAGGSDPSQFEDDSSTP
jgi:excisionase family DNA binding protein